MTDKGIDYKITQQTRYGIVLEDKFHGLNIERMDSSCGSTRGDVSVRANFFYPKSDKTVFEIEEEKESSLAPL